MKTQSNWEKNWEERRQKIRELESSIGGEVPGWAIDFIRTEIKMAVEHELTSLARDLIGCIPEKFGSEYLSRAAKLHALSGNECYNTALSDTRTAQEKLIKERGILLKPNE